MKEKHCWGIWNVNYKYVVLTETQSQTNAWIMKAKHAQWLLQYEFY